MLDPTPLKPGEAYATVADIRDCEDLPAIPVTPGARMKDGSVLPFWTRPDGSPLTILVRAPSFAERTAINQAAKENDDTFVLETCLVCIQEPRFTREQLAVLSARHPAALDAISETAWSLASLPASLIRDEVRRLSSLPPAPADPADDQP